MRKLIENKNYNEIRQALSDKPELANEGIPYDSVNTARAHPLHRICDSVCSGKITDEEGVAIAKIFLEFGANINGINLEEKHDSPLTAASSLSADQLAIFYIEQGAEISHPGAHGGTALHWAAWTGRDKVVEKLVEQGAEIDKICIDFEATPIFWALHGFNSDPANRQNKQITKNYYECVRILVEAGADKSIPNCDGHTVFDLIGDEDLALKHLLYPDTVI